MDPYQNEAYRQQAYAQQLQQQQEQYQKYVRNAQIQKLFARLGFAFGMFMLVAQMASGFISGLAVAISPAVVQQGWFLWVASYVPLYFIAFPLFLVLIKPIPNYAQIPRPAAPVRFGPVKFLVLLLGCMGVVFVLDLVSTLLSSGVAALMGAEAENPLAEVLSSSHPLVNFFVLVVVAPVMEEIIFRYLTYKKLALFGGKVYILFTALLFALFHGNLYQLLYAFVLGCVLGALYYFTGKLLYPILLHFFVNLLGSGVYVLLEGYGLQSALEVWGYISYGIYFVGIAVAVILIISQRKKVKFPPPPTPPPAKKLMFANGGMMFYIILMGISIIAVLFTPLLNQMLEQLTMY